MRYRGQWLALIIVLAGSFTVLGAYAPRIRSAAPPVPERVVGPGGRVVFDGESIRRGQNVWQSIGGQEIGSIWGHGAYVAPDWTADWLHREAVALLQAGAQAQGMASFDSLSFDQQAVLKARLIQAERINTYQPSTGVITISLERAAVFEQLERYYAGVFGNGQNQYAIPRGALTNPEKQRQMAAFFWWTAWAATTDRPGSNITYTNNWPHEPLVANEPTSSAVVWSIISFVLLLAAVGGMVWYFASQEKSEAEVAIPKQDPLLGFRPTASQRATMKYFFVVAALWVVQVALGAITAHYGVEGSGFYGIPLDRWLPYSITRTWHLQIGIFWIATSWLATGLYVAPAVSGHEPRGQKLGVNTLFAALILV